jgi:hypothetical protein
MAAMLRSFLRMQVLDPLRLRGLLFYLPQFVKVFYRLMNDRRVAITTKLVPFLGLLLLISPPILELDAIPVLGELDWVIIGYLALRLFVWLCPPEVVREHVQRVAHGG